MKGRSRKEIVLIIVFAIVFLVTSVLFRVFGITDIWAQLTGTLLGTIITAIVTVLLLNVQTDKEIGHDRDVGIFEKKQEVYHNFIESLKKITIDGKLTIDENTDELQELIYQLGLLQMHANKAIAEQITGYVGEIIGIFATSKKQLESKKYMNLAEKVFAIVALLRDDLYPNRKSVEKNVVDKDYFYIALTQSGLFPDDKRNAATMQKLHIKWWKLFIDELGIRIGKKLVNKPMEELEQVGDYAFNSSDGKLKTAIDDYENNKPIVQFSLIIKNDDTKLYFYLAFFTTEPMVYGFETCNKETNDKDTLVDALPEGYYRYEKFSDPGIGAKRIDSKYDIDFFNTNMNYFNFARANEDDKRKIVKEFVQELGKDISEFLKKLPK